jgi:hypothetical protein
MPENTKIGALWLKERGPFATGTLDIDGKQIKIVVWKTKEKKSEKSPDYTINLDTWKPGQQADPVAQVAKTFDGGDVPF